MSNEMVEIGPGPILIEDVYRVANNSVHVGLSDDNGFVGNIKKGRAALDALWKSNQVVYGVTTGVGDSCEQSVPKELVEQFPGQLAKFHGCGMGVYFDVQTCRAVLLVRLASLKSGFSAVRIELLEALITLLNNDVIPRIPSEGSVGASGDLTPLSYVAAVLMGEREVYFEGEVRSTADVFSKLGIAPLELKPKEGLAIMNGTSVMTALACDAYRRAKYLVSLGASITAIFSEVLMVNKAHFDHRIFEQKPHPGQMAVAKQIATEVGYNGDYSIDGTQRVQATYAIRCAPHIIGVLADSLFWVREYIETELNSVNDNPLIDPETGDVLHGGNFYGGHIAFAMDSLKNAVANCADLVDRQMALIVNERASNGLPANLSAPPIAQRPISHAFKAVHIATSAWAAEALKQAIPASIFSRSTESHNQDKVSLGTIAARDCIRVLELTEQVFAAALLAGVQAIDIRVARGDVDFLDLSSRQKEIYGIVRDESSYVDADRPLEHDLRALVAKITEGQI